MDFVLSRFQYVFVSYPNRLIRFYLGLIGRKSNLTIPSKSLGDYLMNQVFNLADLILMPDILDLLINTYGSKRKLSREERQWVDKLFGNAVNSDFVYLNENVNGIKDGLFTAYVSFNCINAIRKMEVHVVLHEMVHVWQYQRFGSIYIYKALKAQNSLSAYDYGGGEGLKIRKTEGQSFYDFNFEQQGQLIEDYVRNIEQLDSDLELKSLYEFFIQQMNEIDATFVA